MNRSWLTRGVLVASFVLAACSGSEGPSPFDTTSTVESRLEARYGAPFVVARGEGRAFWLSPLANTRNVATTVQGARDEALSLVRDFARDLGTSEVPELTVVRAEQDETGGFAVRLAQVLPGTSIPIDEHGASFDLAADGSIVSASASLSDTADFPRALRLTKDEADRAIRTALAGRTVSYTDAPRPIARRDARGARVEHAGLALVDGDAYDLRVDDASGKVEARPVSLGFAGEDVRTDAFAFRAYPLTPALKAIPDAAKSFGYPISVTRLDGSYHLVQQSSAARSKIATVEKTGGGGRGEAAKWAWISSPDASEFTGQFPLTKKVGDLALPTPSAVDVHYNAALVDAAFRRVVHESPSKDGVMVSLTRANDAVVLERTEDEYGVVHWNEKSDPDATRFFPSYNPVTNAVHYGDGGLYASIGQYVLPTGVALDVAGHEWTHAFMTRKTRSALVGMDGALQEVVCDAVGKIIALRNGDRNEDVIGAGLFVSRFEVRSFVDPKTHVAQYARRLSPLKTEKGMAPMPSHVSALAVACANEGLADQGCVHYNAGPGNRAFYLMKQELKKARGKWLDALEELWFYSAGHAVMARSPLPAAKYESLALQQTDYARRWDAASQRAVACAWSAVGALSVAGRGIVCAAAQGPTERAAPAPDGCGGKADGYYCDPEAIYGATLCQHGSVAGGHQCPSGRACVVADETSRAARLDENGLPTCEPVAP